MKSAIALLLIVSLSLSPAFSRVVRADPLPATSRVAHADPPSTNAPSTLSRIASADPPPIDALPDDPRDDAPPDDRRASTSPDDPRASPPRANPPPFTVPLLVVATTPANPRYTLHREKLTALILAGSSVALSLTGGLLIGMHNESDPALDSGIAFTAIGGALVMPAIIGGVFSAGHDAGLRELPRLLAAPPEQRWALIDAAERAARREEQTGMGLFFGGFALFAAGLGMFAGGLNGLNFNEEGGTSSGGNGPLLILGITSGLVGGALWLSGMVVWTHGGGKHRGVRETRAALSLAPTGIGGRF